MALTRILRLSSSPSLHHCGRAFSTALNHIPVVFPDTINRGSKTCSKRLIGPFLRNFSSSPEVSDEYLQSSVTEDLICSVKSLRRDVESLRTEVILLSAAVSSIQKCNARSVAGDKDDGNDFVGDSNEKETAKKSDFSEAMATHFNARFVINPEKKVVENMSDFSCNRDEKEKKTEKISDFSEAMATHFNTKIVISQDDKAAEKMSDASEAIRIRDTGDNNEKLAEKTSGFSGEMPKSDIEGNNENTTENLQKSDAEEYNNDTVSNCKEKDPLLKKIESEISHAEEFSRVSSQGVNFPDDFPFNVENDIPGSDSITLKRRYKSKDIIVQAGKPSVFTPITAEYYQFHKNISFRMPIHVEIRCANSEENDIAFDCAAYGTGYSIESVYSGECVYTNKLDFSELNDSLKTEFRKYLENRGITPSAANIIFGYMLDKANREKLRSLYNLKKLLEAGKTS
ncbi:hypothetical protein DCAR_0727017 [Daucus carota subsp. sativus]|uniref:Uncharacterized protein n=1 Tax=Daucus carota subsp. sativus TaxID=79200 RepID=A0A164SP85_DAUCS|nr:PREDICTED: uncharacterized protein LOC108195594 [Daucus carota subsp. sativus]WOH07585.1 hypothetical protein DCAR_0727017 [Daucus carota subsp. sativus]